MATDRTEPRTKLIVGIALLSIVSLLFLRWGFVAYYQHMVDEQEQWNVRNYRSGLLAELRERAERDLTQSPLPINEAMAMIARGARPESIEPRPSNDLDPLRGWSVRPNPAYPETPWPGVHPIPQALVPASIQGTSAAVPPAPAGGAQPGVAAPEGTVPGTMVGTPGESPHGATAPTQGQETGPTVPGHAPEMPAVQQPGGQPAAAQQPNVVIPEGQAPAAHPPAAEGHE